MYSISNSLSFSSLIFNNALLFLIVVAVVLVVLLSNLSTMAFSFSNGQAASVIIGQPNGVTNDPNLGFPGKSSLVFPAAVIFDHGILWVVDEGNNRILGYSAPYTIGERASLVLGQTDFAIHTFAPASANTFFNPGGLTFDSGGDLWVADQQNNRVLEFNPPFTIGQAAIKAFLWAIT